MRGVRLRLWTCVGVLVSLAGGAAQESGGGVTRSRVTMARGALARIVRGPVSEMMEVLPTRAWMDPMMPPRRWVRSKRVMLASGKRRLA